ncbi:MAG TPA: methyl-accepting chemotaxis protein [Nitrospirota bacterium]|nr:methyl-accepting chemotaxis protein [Nitrospirota bacterium]
MKFLNNMKIRYKIMLTVMCGAVGVIFVGGAALTSLRQNLLLEKQESTRHVVEVAYTTIEHYFKLHETGALSDVAARNAALEAVKSLRYQEKEYFWINDMQPVMIMHPYKPELNGKDLSDFKDPEGKKLFVQFVETVRSSGSGFVFYLWPKPGFDKPVPKVSYVKGFKPWNWVVGSGIYLDDLNALFWKEARNFCLTTLILTFIILLICWPVMRSITKPVNALSRMRNEISAIAQGDLRKKCDYVSEDEVGHLARDLNAMSTGLSSIAESVLHESGNIGMRVESLRSLSEQTASDTKDQAAQASTIAAAAEEMTQTIGDIAKNAASASDTSARAMESAASGKVLADESINTVNRVSSSTIELSGMVEKLNKRVSEISGITTVIKSIADQTNLLALNAAIEAARAGEQGRGFAVVADEVRSLAERTIKATEEISDKITAVKTESEQTAKSMDGATNEVQKAVKDIRGVGEAFSSIVAAVQNARDQVALIAAAVEQQSATSEDIAANIEKTSKLAADMDKRTTGILDDVAKLSAVEARLREQMAAFKI